MRNIILSIILSCFTCAYSFGQNPFWVRLDRRIIKEFNYVDKSSPIAVEAYFLKNRKRLPFKENLGFGWSLSNMAVAGGYTSISGIFFYFNDTIASYTLHSRLPREARLVRKYKEWLKESFSMDSNGIKSLNYQTHLLSKPLASYNGSMKMDSLPNDILSYMSPHSGTMYGYSGGLNNALLQNRSNFNRLNKPLNSDIVYLLMHSINPATRFTAIEYYRRNAQEFDEDARIQNWTNKVYNELPLVHTLMGCLGETLNSRLLVEFCLRIEE